MSISAGMNRKKNGNLIIVEHVITRSDLKNPNHLNLNTFFGDFI